MDTRVRTAAATLVAGGALAIGWRARSFTHMMDETMWGPGRMNPPSAPPPTPVPTPVDVAAWGAILVVCAGIVLLGRRQLPGFLLGVTGLVAYGALGGPSFGGFFAALALSIGLLRDRGASRATPWLGLILVPLWSSWWRAPTLGLADWRMWTSVVSQFLWVLVPTLLVALARDRHAAREHERAEAIERAASEERLRLAREIHDVVGHSLSMISLQSAVALRLLDADPAQARTSLDAIRSSSKDALTELRRTLGVFRGDDTPLAPTPSLSAIPQLVADVRAGGVRVDLAPLPDAAGLGAATEAAAYRIVQEALTNAVRHAPGRAISVAVGRAGRGLDVRVADDGAAGVRAEEGSGLRGMRERVDALGGTLEAGPTASGFVVTAWLPEGEP